MLAVISRNRIAWSVISLVTVCMAFSVYLVINRWYRVRKATNDWSNVGGSVDAGDLPIIGPIGIGIGSTPGFGPAEDTDQILRALDGMRLLGTVDSLSINSLPLSSKQIQKVVKEWHVSHIHISKVTFDDACLQASLTNPRLRTLSINECPVSASALLKVKHYPNIRVSINIGADVTDAEVKELRSELGRQIIIYGRAE